MQVKKIPPPLPYIGTICTKYPMDSRIPVSIHRITMAPSVHDPLVPPVLYRIHYPTSQTTLLSDGLHTKEANPTCIPLADVVNHLNWSTSLSSPFISVFCSLIHAKTWARKLRNNELRFAGGDYGEIKILEIDCRRLAGMVFVLIEHVARNTLEGEDLMAGDELLFLHFIPKEAIVGTIPF